jgi:hypothetical protein
VQEFQMVKGTLTTAGKSTSISGKLSGEQLTFTADGQEYTGVVRGNRIEGSVRAGSATSNWTATRAN